MYLVRWIIKLSVTFYKSKNKALVTVLRSFEKVANSNPAIGVQRLFLPSVFFVVYGIKHVHNRSMYCFIKIDWIWIFLTSTFFEQKECCYTPFALIQGQFSSDAPNGKKMWVRFSTRVSVFLLAVRIQI